MTPLSAMAKSNLLVANMGSCSPHITLGAKQKSGSHNNGSQPFTAESCDS